MRRDELLLYYERELRYVRKLASGFAEKYPEVAGRLLLEPNKCEDPHVERLIEAFAMLTARVQQRLDSDLSEISDSLLSILYPHYLAPVPSATIVQLEADPDAAHVEGGFRVDARSLLHSRPIEGVRCTFRTSYPVRLHPIRVEALELVHASSLGGTPPPGTQSALRIALRTQAGIPVAELGIDALRFFLDAASGDIRGLYELFVREPTGLGVRAEAGAPTLWLPPEQIAPVGFERDEGLIDYPAESFVGYRLLQEYFAFPDKFLFVDLRGLAAGTRRCEGDTLELLVTLPQSVAQLDLFIEPSYLKLGCTPAVNLFPKTADPIRLDHRSVEYLIQPDARAPDCFEVHTVTEVAASAPGQARARTYAPFYGIRHGATEVDSGTYWHTVRRESLRRGDSGTDVYLSLVDASLDVQAPPTDIVHVETLCSNRGVPARLPFGDARGDFQMEGRPGVTRITALRKPTEPLPPPIGKASRWRLISHLTLNHLSLGSEGSHAGALAALREILKLYDFEDSPVSRQRIGGLVGLSSRRVVRRVGRGAASAFARGVETRLEFDPAQYTGSGVLLFASVLERFLGLYSSVNSFTQTVAAVRDHPGELKRWRPRSGELQLV